MGLTIHYNLRSGLTQPENIRTVVQALRTAATQLPFQEVGAVNEFRGPAADFEQSARDDPERWLKIQAGRYLDVDGYHVSVKPTYIIAFTIQPGPGCEPANVGFCQYPTTVDVKVGDRPRRVVTHLDGWTWSSFCKTQYASARQHGGIENFLRCHVGLVKLLDFAAKSEVILVGVHDESKYFELRDLQQLVNTVGEWNQFVAAYAGILKDQAAQVGVQVESVITGFPDFEHLEAAGLAKLRQGLGKSN